ncbi:MAG: response regulator transcription factor [Cyanobacteriota bacterium]
MNSINKNKRILIIDSEPCGIDWILESCGFTVVLCTDSNEGLRKLFSKEQFDLILIDLIMPKMTGLYILRKIRENKQTKALPVIILTSVNNKNNHIMSLNVGADDYILKPFEVSGLIARINSLLRRVEWDKERCNAPDDKNNTTISNLTGRQAEILKLISCGLSNKDIADRLVLSETTVKAHLRTIFKKLKVTSRTEAVFVGIKKGLVKELKV